jgi:hypothetical protein
LRYSSSIGAIVAILALTVSDTPAENAGRKRDHAAMNADGRMGGNQDKAYQRLEDGGYRLEQTHKYRM